MSVEILPQYPNLLTLNVDEIKQIEQKCIERGHLDKNVGLLEQINEDNETLKNLNVTKEDIYTNHRNMHLKFNKLDKFDSFTSQDHGDHYKPLFEKLPNNFGEGWCCRSVTTNEIELNNQKLLGRLSCNDDVDFSDSVFSCPISINSKCF